MKILKIMTVYLFLGSFLAGCSSSLSFKSEEPDDLLVSIANFPETLNGNFCEDLDTLADIYERATLAGIDPKILNLDIPFLESVLRNFDFEAAAGRYNAVQEKYTKVPADGKISGKTKKDGSTTVKTRTEASVSEFLSAALGDCIMQEGRIDTLVDVLFDIIYAKYSSLPLALLSNTGFPGLIGIEAESFNNYDSCFREIDTFVLNDLKFFTKNTNYDQPISAFLEGFEVLSGSVPECFMSLIGGGDDDDEGGVIGKEQTCETDFALYTSNPYNKFDTQYIFPDDHWTSGFTEITANLMGLYTDPDKNPIMPDVQIGATDPSNVLFFHNGTPVWDGYSASVNSGDVFVAKCADGYIGTVRTIFISE